MTDLIFTHSGELDVVHVEGNTEEGIEFVDAWNRGTIQVMDAGIIIIPSANAFTMAHIAIDNGLSIKSVNGV